MDNERGGRSKPPKRRGEGIEKPGGLSCKLGKSLKKGL